MQRPRRTSEFHDDPGGLRRQSRAQQRSTAGTSPSGAGTAVKFSTRQSRIAVLSRPSSSDRAAGSTNAFLTVPPSTQRGVTPQKSTPLANKVNANRVLFTTEKHRPIAGSASKSGPLHNDKKWVQEQSQRITEYLLNYPSIGGLSSEFLNRGLRQISIKQFVAIVNFFLSFIWGKRYVVGNNHVDDIIQILQRLHYPHALNKSWLKTPNTQHSFGYVLVLFDFLMDFVPPPKSVGDLSIESVDYFELQEPQEMNASRVTEEIFQIPDLEFQYELLRNTEEGFMLWDTQMNDDFDNLQKATCDLLIQKMCNFSNSEAIDGEIEKLQITLKELEEQMPIEDIKLVKSKSDKVKKLHELNSEITHLSEMCRENERNLKRLSKKTSELSIDVDEAEKQIEELKETIEKQLCNVEERDQLITEKNQMEQVLKIEGNTVRSIEDRNYQKQVLYSRILRRFTDQVGQFNELMRTIAFSDIPECRKISLEDLQLPLRPDELKLQKLLPLLQHIKEQTMRSINENKEKIIGLQQHNKEVTNEVDTKLETQLNSLRSVNAAAAAHLEKMRQHVSEEIAALHSKAQEMQNELSTADKCIEELQQLNEKKLSEVHLKKEHNERTMQQAEEKHAKLLAQRRAFIEAYTQAVEAKFGGGILQEMAQKLELQEKELEKLKQEL